MRVLRLTLRRRTHDQVSSPALSAICIRREAQKKINGLAPVSSDVVTTVLSTPPFWTLLRQLIKTTKPLVDAIGNLETREATLADCMLELIGCARAMQQLQLDEDEDSGFFMHARAVFNKRFYAMNTDIHSLALFLHPHCRKLAVNQASSGRSLEVMMKTALGIANKWRWSEVKAMKLVEDMRQYYACQGDFAGGNRQALTWWELLANGESHPLRALAVALFSIVPHAAEVERLFSCLGGVQTAKRCNLAVDTFEALGKIRSNLAYELWKKTCTENGGRAPHRRHAHSHIRPEAGLNLELSKDLEDTWTITPTLATRPADEQLTTPEDITLEELEKAFARLEEEKKEENMQEVNGEEVLEGAVYSFEEYEKAIRGTAPTTFQVQVRAVDNDGAQARSWAVGDIMAKAGLSS